MRGNCCELNDHSDRRNSHSFTFKFAGILLVTFVAAASGGCTRSSVPAGQVEVQPTTIINLEEPAPTYVPFTTEGTYAVMMVPEDEVLVIRNPAGAAGSEVATLEYDDTGLLLTGNSTALGSSTWIEVDLGREQTGWVNATNLTESVSREVFCADVRSLELLNTILLAFSNQDGSLLAQVTNPRRGLLVRNEWWNRELEFKPDMISGLFSDRNEYEWGEQAGGRFEVKGTFSTVVANQIEEVVSQEPELSCGEIQTGVSSITPTWPTAYFNLNYYMIFKPAPVGGNPYGWRAWGIGMEYVQGIPYLTVLVHFHGDV